jgi:sigma-B regulation protein RsbU (phosphoserine phosphatase)
MAASLLTASLQAFAAGPIEDGLPPEAIAERLSRLLFRRTPPEKYATAVVAVLDTASGLLRYTNAGHNQPLLLRAGGEIEELPSNSVPLGLLAAAAFSAAEVRLEPGDTLLFYTDGIVEAFNPADVEYGLDRLKEIAARHLDSAPAALGAALDRDLVAFAEGVPFADDRTVVVVRRVSAASAEQSKAASLAGKIQVAGDLFTTGLRWDAES